MRHVEAFEAFAAASGDRFADINGLGKLAFLVCGCDLGVRSETTGVVDEVDARAGEAGRRHFFGWLVEQPGDDASGKDRVGLHRHLESAYYPCKLVAVYKHNRRLARR